MKFIIEASSFLVDIYDIELQGSCVQGARLIVYDLIRSSVIITMIIINILIIILLIKSRPIKY